MPVIPAYQDMEVEGSWAEASPGKSMRPYLIREREREGEREGERKGEKEGEGEREREGKEGGREGERKEGALSSIPSTFKKQTKPKAKQTLT
jgi:hypothetical protein